jgi:hypothetical protein
VVLVIPNATYRLNPDVVSAVMANAKPLDECFMHDGRAASMNAGKPSQSMERDFSSTWQIAIATPPLGVV